ncbi:MAG: DUF4845 domain-containing protein [Pseudomonadales bacterium]|nr:DUF4845 domain-containing protein [Pseudomonadales bacterium]
MKQLLVSHRNRQQGISKSGMLLLLLVIGLFLTVGLKLIPVYVDHNVITGVMRTLQENGRLNSMTQSELRQELANSLRVNNIRDFDMESVILDRSGSQNQVHVVYEKRVPVFSNIDIVVSFDDMFD